MLVLGNYESTEKRLFLTIPDVLATITLATNNNRHHKLFTYIQRLPLSTSVINFKYLSVIAYFFFHILTNHFQISAPTASHFSTALVR